MADVIGRQQKSAGPTCIFGPDYANTRDTAEKQPDHQFASAVGCRFELHCLSVSLTCRLGKVYFQADSFL